ncbi:RICIN domain-containing protein [Streptomyces sp. NPDC057908]|uniref:RICIN domain-containing protein n=1 Tax=Streptomyces sp. NPDC057908 TaxID=3346276 RepID=UPI0036F0DB92
MADQQLDVFGGEDEEERLWEALSSFKELVRGLVEMTGLSTNELADRHGFGKGKVSTWQNAKREQPNIPPLQFVEALIDQARERANLQDGAADVFLRQYGELLQLYCARANPHNVHRQMLIDYQNTLLIRELNNATNAALKQIVELTEELQTLRGDRDEERRHRIALEQQIASLKSQNQDRAAEKKTALAQLDQIRADLTAYKSDQQLEKWKPGAEQGGSHTHHPHQPAFVPLPPPPGRDTKRRRPALSLIAVGVVVVSLAVYVGTQLRGDQNDHKGTADGKPDQTSILKPPTDGSASPGRSPNTSVTATPPQAAGGSSTAGGGSTGGGSSSNGGGGGADPTKGAAGGSSKGGSSGDSNKVPSSPATLSPGSVSRLKNAATHQCVSADDSVYPSIGTCSSSDTYTWTLRRSDGDTFELVNRASGHCLAAPYSNDSSAVTTRCGDEYSGGYIHWRMETTTAAGQTLKNTETNRCLEIDSTPYNGVKALVTTCNSDEPQQLWTRG